MTNRANFGRLFVATLLSLLVLASNSQGQGVDPGTPTTPTTPTTPDTPVATPDTGGDTGGTSVTGGGEGEAFDQDFSNVEIEISEDTRNQGFVGPTSASLQEFGFIGVASESSGPPLAEGASFGGGVNSGAGGGGRAGGAAGGRAQGQGFGAAGQLGFPVIRSNLRTRLRPTFAAPQLSSDMISSRFNNQFYRLPEASQFSGQFQVSIVNRTATLTGTVNSQADIDRLVRQLRLEPGVYAIDNQLKIAAPVLSRN